jgi:hypothetical protein
MTIKLVNVYSAAGLLEADMLKAFLEAQGLQVFLSQESVGRTLGLSAGILGMVDVLVPESQVVDAQTLLAQIKSGEFDYSEFDDDINNSLNQNFDD